MEARAWPLTIARRQVARYLKKGALDRRARDAVGLQTPRLQDGDAEEIERRAGLAPLRQALAEELSRLGGAIADRGRPAMRVLDELEREIERVAAEAGQLRPRRRWWRSGAFLVALPLAVAAVAVAATRGVLSGEPVKNPPGLHPNPKTGLGVIVGSGKLLGVRAADPAGGPDWALRMVKTSRGLGCVQLGRVVDGKLACSVATARSATTASSTSAARRSSSRTTASRPTAPGGSSSR